MSLIPEEKIFADLYSGLVNYKNEFYRRYDLVMEQQTEAFKRGQVPENWSEGDQEAFRSYPGNENKTVLKDNFQFSRRQIKRDQEIMGKVTDLTYLNR